MDQRRDQATGNHKKDIDADEPAAERSDAVVEQHHRQNRERAQPVDFRAVVRAVEICRSCTHLNGRLTLDGGEITPVRTKGARRITAYRRWTFRSESD